MKHLHRSRLRLCAVALAVLTATSAVWLFGGGLANAGTTSFTPTGTYQWVDGTSLGSTAGASQWASATVSGLTDKDHVAGFNLRAGTNQVKVALSGTEWRIETDGDGVVTGGYGAAASGTLRASIDASNVVTLAYNGATVMTRTLSGTYDGRGITPTVWQSTATVTMTNIQSNVGVSYPSTAPSTPGSSPTPTPSTTPSATPSTPPAGATWLSGAASSYAGDGSFGAWRGEPVTVVGTWDDSLDAQTNLWSLDGFSNWSGAVDEAIGAIYKDQGESWSQAAAGAYDSRWRQSLTNLKAKWGSRNPANLYIRFAHEMNGSWSDWSVNSGEEADFRAALTRFSNLRYSIIPQAHVVLCTNDGTSTGIDVRNLFVSTDSQGRRVVDVYATDSYNQYPHRTDYNDIMSSFNNTDGNGAPVGIEAHRKFAQSKGVPFAVSEWGNCGISSQCDGGGGESTAYVQAFNAWARSHAGSVSSPAAGQLLYEVQFNLWDKFELYPTTAQSNTAAAYAALVWGK